MLERGAGVARGEDQAKGMPAVFRRGGKLPFDSLHLNLCTRTWVSYCELCTFTSIDMQQVSISCTVQALSQIESAELRMEHSAVARVAVLVCFKLLVGHSLLLCTGSMDEMVIQGVVLQHQILLVRVQTHPV